MAPLDKDTPFTREFRIVGTRPVRPDGIDKVTGRARYGADMVMPGMLVGRILRSPHAHARIRSIDTSKAEALEGVKAVITRRDFPETVPDDVADILENVMAGEKALYDGHAVAAVAAVSDKVAREALKLIEVDYEVLPHVIDVDEAMKPGAPVLHEGRSDETVPEGVSANVMHRYEYGHGDIEAGLAEADVVIERSFRTAATHQGYIEPHACVASLSPDGYGEMWVCTQGHYMVRNTCAALLGLDIGDLRVTASEIGGGFGGKTTVFIEPVALALSRKANRPVKLVMSREEVFRATGPTAHTSSTVRIGMKKDGTITAGYAEYRYSGGAFPGSAVDLGAMAAFAPYDLEAVKTVGWDLDPFEVRLKNAAREGTRSSYGPTYKRIGLVETLEAARRHPHYGAPLGPNQGRGVACGFWFNFGGDTCVSMNLAPDGTVTLSEGNPDIGGSRASLTMMAAEELGVPYEQVRTTIADTGSLGQNEVTDGSRVTFAVGLATIEAARNMIRECCRRAAMIWGIDEEAVEWVDGAARPAGPNAGKFPPMTLEEIAAIASKTGGPIAGHYEVTAQGAGVSFATHICDVEVDPETGKVTILRYTIAQDAGKAIHPDYVEGQFQGGAVQGIGWAINEEYVYGEDGRLQNPSFLDYRIPVASDLPMIDTIIVEVPNPGHPYGVRGVGETSIVPPLAAIANAVSRATGVRMTELPMSPPRLLKAIREARG